MKKITLSNGIPVILEHMPSTKVITILILFKVGSRNETKSINGISHFLEHLFFKGTTNRPTTLEITKELDGVGADFNAFTSKDYTGYYVKVANRHAKLAIDILEDLLFHPIFDPKEIDRERGVIIEEINMYEDNPMATAEELAEQLMYGADHPLGFRIAGPKENILKVTRKQIMKYRDTYYHPKNMVIVMTGNLPKNTAQTIKKHFGQAPKSRAATPRQKKFTEKQQQSRLHVYNKKTAQSHLALNFPSVTYTAKDYYVAQVMATILGGNMSSRLFINVRERQGVCYYIRAGISPYEDMGTLSIQAGFDTARIHQAIEAIIAELVTMRVAEVSDEELHQAKEYIRGKMYLRLEDSENVAWRWAKTALFEKQLHDVSAEEKALQQVTKQQVLALAQKTLVAMHANLVIVGPYTKTQEKSFLKHLRF
ncbi:MAG: insulinase family protein [Candidatus Kerfeldbacteria bacterium]|nr:insulinase family protein [Candidatus Kerfeldbacteria bacterium]